MDNDNDFTFCQVGSHVDQDGTEAQKLLPDIGGIVIKDELTNDGAGSQSNGFVRKIELLSNGASKKEATFGSLSFSVIDASPSKQSSAISGQALSENAGNEVKVPQEPRAAARKLAPRVKVPFEKGYSPMDWMKLTRTHPDLAGLKGQSNRRLISMSEVKEHHTEGSMWTVLKGRVYNLSPYMKFHPGDVAQHGNAIIIPCSSPFPDFDITSDQLGVPSTHVATLAEATPSDAEATGNCGFNTSHVATFPESEPTLSDAEATPSDTKATGYDILMKAVGKDCTSLFNKYHAWVNAEFLLEKCLVGTLDDSQ